MKQEHKNTKSKFHVDIKQKIVSQNIPPNYAEQAKTDTPT
jgi:hypothetical protein